MTTLLYHECTWTEKTPDACPACSGEVCWLCGAGMSGSPSGIECTHDSLERHSYYQDRFETKLTDLIEAAARELKSRFPGCRVRLSDFHDPESGETCKRLQLITHGSVDDSLDKWERFQEEWWLDRMDPRLSVDFVFSEGVYRDAEMDRAICDSVALSADTSHPTRRSVAGGVHRATDSAGSRWEEGMRDLIKKWRQESAEWHSLGSPLVAGAYDGCARDLESALNEREKNVTDNGFRTAPARYVQQERETIDRIRDSMTDAGFVAFCLGTAMRYEDRRGAKGDPEGDTEKARWYRQMIAHVNGDGPDPRADRPGFQPYVRKGG